VVAYRTASAPEIVDDGRTGLLRDDLTGLAAALTVVDRLDRDECRAAVASRFTTERMVRDHLDLFGQLAGADTAKVAETAA
jgi:glycosyltransferase involved in cell wall biosynthesis